MEQQSTPRDKVAAYGGWIVAAFLIVVLLTIAVRSCGMSRGEGGQKQEQLSLEGCMLVFVSEKQTPPADAILFTDRVKAAAAAHSIEWRWLDEEEEQGTKVSALAGVKPPLVALVKEKKVLRSRGWDSSFDVEGFLR